MMKFIKTKIVERIDGSKYVNSAVFDYLTQEEAVKDVSETIDALMNARVNIWAEVKLFDLDGNLIAEEAL